MLRQISNTLRRTISSDTPSRSLVSNFKLQDESLVTTAPHSPELSQPTSPTHSKSTSSDPLFPDLTPAELLKDKEDSPKKENKEEGGSLGTKLRGISRQISGGSKKEGRRVSATGKGMKGKPQKVVICVAFY